jgi:hypothetical protein
VACHVARVLARDRRVVVVAMGRGGPAEPELVEVPPTLDELLALSRSGRHAASDHLEAAALAGVPAIGCLARGRRARRRSVLLERPRRRAARCAARSGAARLRRQRRGASSGRRGRADPRRERRPRRARRPQRVSRLVSDLVVDTGGADREAIRSVSDVPVVSAELRLRPVEPLRGRRTAVFTTGPAPTDELDAEIVHISRNLARRDALREELERVDAEVYLVELKAAAVDVVAEAALARGAEVVLAANDVVSDELDDRILDWPSRRCARERAAPDHAAARLGGDELGLPYSRGLMARSLMAAGVAGHRAYALASRVTTSSASAARAGSSSSGSRRSRSTCSARRRDASRSSACAATRSSASSTCRSWSSSAARPGPGKSTVATELAYRFGITRVTSTDFVRQTMRAFFSRAFMPAIHQSSFEAGDVYPDAEDPVEYGFVQQARNVLVGVGASSERALEEDWSLVLEGVHLVPGMVELPRPELAVSVFVVLSIEDEEEHLRHFHHRNEDSEQRPGVPLPRALRRHPPAAGGHRGARASPWGAGDRERGRGQGGPDGRGSRPRRRRAESHGHAMSENAAYDADEERPCQCQAYLRATERAALVSARWLGRDDEDAAEEAAATGMRATLDVLPISGRVVFGSLDDSGGSRPARSSAPGARRSTSRSTRSRGAASWRAAATARCR